MKFLGSTLAIVVGVLQFAGATASIANGAKDADPQAGLVIVLGALAYRSIKKRTLGLKESTLLRKAYEAVLLGLAAFLVLGQNNLAFLIEERPFQNLIIPAWVCAACYYASRGKRAIQTPSA